MRRALAALLLLAGCASTPPQPPPPPAPPGAPEVRAVRIRETIVVDGADGDPGWVDAPESEIPLDGRPADRCLVKAAVYRGTLFLRIRWKDPTETRERSSSLFSGPWEAHRAARMGDLVGLTFPITGPFPEAPDPWVPCTMDRWEWDSGIRESDGLALDAILSNSTDGFEGRDWAQYSPKLWMHMDDGTITRSGSIANVSARGLWKEGAWTVEFARALDTRHPDDRQFTGLTETPFQIEIRDLAAGSAAGATDAGKSPVLRLVLPPPEVEPRGPLADPAGPSNTGR
jgi:hypothetical protein